MTSSRFPSLAYAQGPLESSATAALNVSKTLRVA